MDTLQLAAISLSFLALLISFIASYKSTGIVLTKFLGVAGIICLGLNMFFLAWMSTKPIDLGIVATTGVWLLNISRLLESKQKPSYVKFTVLRDSKYFFILFLTLMITSSMPSLLDYLNNVFPQITVFVALVVLASTLMSLRRYRFRPNDDALSTVPTVTLAIPARNEDHALKQNIEAALTSNYEKLEIIVLDDCSQDSTADVIRSFAHKGVRFVQGAQPSSSWIGKNQAYKTLLEQASGDYVVFCGVDVRLSVDTISQMIKTVQNENLDMISVLPVRLNTDFLSHIIQPVRHFWQLALPRFMSSTPAVISSCWLVNRQAIEKVGGFDAVQNSLSPEAYFAKTFSSKKAYRFYISGTDLDLTTKKKPSSQIDTAIRTTYPALKRSFALSWLTAVMVTGFLVMPFIGGAIDAIEGQAEWFLVAALSLTLSHVLILTKIAPASLISGLITFPFSMLAEVVIIAVSAWKYEFSEIYWKGRNVCIPALRYVKKSS